MNYLAIDTSGDLAVLLKIGEKTETRYLKGCNTRHSLTLMPYIEEVLTSLKVSLSDLDFIAAVVGPGSFTGIRIGVATVKALCFASGKPLLSLTSFDLLSYSDSAPGKCFCVINANHGNYYCSAFEDKKVTLPPCFLNTEQVKEQSDGYTIVSAEALDFENVFVADKLSGLINAADNNFGKVESDIEKLVPLYIKRSQAEEELC